jgi:Ca2+:H+ antiporter
MASNMRQKSEGDGGLTLSGRDGSDHPRTSISSGLSQKSSGGGTTIGEVGTFRSAALARRWVNSTRRNQLRRTSVNEASEKAVVNEMTGLKSSLNGCEIPEESTSFVGVQKYHIQATLKEIILGKYVSVLLLLAPFAVMSHYLNWSAMWIFWLNFLVMIPLASILGDFTEEAALHTNQTIGGLLNATFGNAVEVVVAIQALLANEIRVVQASMIGSIFSNLLLVLGCCFFFGGLKHKEQTFNATAATANMGLLSLSSIALVLPTPFAEYYEVQDEHVLIISRFAACFLLFMYLQLLVFQLYTHSDIFDGAANDENGEDEAGEAEVEEEEPTMPMKVALIGLFVTTLSITIFSDFLVGSIDEFCEVSGVSKTFVGLIILPIVGNAVEHITAVTVAIKNKMDLAMGGKSVSSDCKMQFLEVIMIHLFIHSSLSVLLWI